MFPEGTIIPETILIRIREANITEISNLDIFNLFHNVKYEPEKQCWLRGEDWSTYSTITINGTQEKAHRVSFIIFKKKIPVRFVCHTCDRKGCINPDHLFAGSASDNSKDAVNKGRLFPPKIRPSKETSDLKFLDDMLAKGRIDEFEHQKLRVKVIERYKQFYRSR